eukprot:6121071-Pyramimonas_sp.AAC.1
MIDITPADGTGALAAVMHKQPYLGFCFTEQHVLKLQSVLDAAIWREMQTEDSPLYQNGLVAALNPAEEDGDDEKKTPQNKDKDKKGKDKDDSKK